MGSGIAKKAGIGAAAGAGTTGAAAVGLAATGFTSSGVAMGSIAAGIQAGIGNVAAGSAFAVAQSVAATGFLFSPVLPIAVGAGALIGGLIHFFKKWWLYTSYLSFIDIFSVMVAFLIVCSMYILSDKILLIE